MMFLDSPDGESMGAGGGSLSAYNSFDGGDMYTVPQPEYPQQQQQQQQQYAPISAPAPMPLPPAQSQQVHSAMSTHTVPDMQQQQQQPIVMPPTQRGHSAPSQISVSMQPVATTALAPAGGGYHYLGGSPQGGAAAAPQVALLQPADSAPQGPGYFDTLWARRREVGKLCVLALVVLLAMALHSAAWHYLRDYVESGALTQGQEVAIRVGYPLVILLLLWHAKAFMCGSGKGGAVLPAA